MTLMKMMMQMTKDEWLDWYVQHGGQKDLHLHDDESVLFHPEHGFISFFFHDILEIHHCAGDGKYWQNVIIQIMKMHDLNRVRFFTTRNPKAWIRKFGGHIRGYYMEVDLLDTKI